VCLRCYLRTYEGSPHLWLILFRPSTQLTLHPIAHISLSPARIQLHKLARVRTGFTSTRYCLEMLRLCFSLTLNGVWTEYSAGDIGGMVKADLHPALKLRWPSRFSSEHLNVQLTGRYVTKYVTMNRGWLQLTTDVMNRDKLLIADDHGVERQENLVQITKAESYSSYSGRVSRTSSLASFCMVWYPSEIRKRFPAN
jgi:hypothetical protein